MRTTGGRIGRSVWLLRAVVMVIAISSLDGVHVVAAQTSPQARLPAGKLQDQARLDSTPPDNLRYQLPQRVYEAHETNYYDITMTADGHSTDAREQLTMQMTLLLKEDVAKAEKDASLELAYHMLSAVVKLSGDITREDDFTARTPEIVFTREPGGAQHVKMTGGDPNIVSNLSFGIIDFSQDHFPFYPVQAVKVGDTWPALADGKSIGKVKLEALETVDGLECFRIQARVVLKPGSGLIGKPNLASIYWLDRTTGRIVKKQMTTELQHDKTRAQITLRQRLLDKETALARMKR